MNPDTSESTVQERAREVETRDGVIVNWNPAEATLRESEARLAGIIGSAMDAIITIDAEQRIVVFNAAAEHMFRCQASEAIGQPIERFILPEFQEAHRRHVRSFGRTGITNRSIRSPGTLMAVRADGERFPMEATISQLEVGGQKLFTSIIRDITERKHAEEIIERQAYLLDFTQDAILTWEIDGPIVFWNRGAEDLYGYSKEVAIGRVSHDLLRTEFPSGALEALHTGGEWKGELVQSTATGSRIIVESHMVCVLEPDRVLVLETNRDITERKQAEGALRESQARLASVIASAMDAIMTVDGEQRIILFNGAAEKMFGCPAEEALGKPVDFFIPEQFRQVHREHIFRFGRTHVTRRSMGKLGAIFGRRTDGQEFPIEASISQVEAAGQKLYTVILRDITERLRDEEEIRQLNAELERRVFERTLELEVANKELEAFTYSVSHDLRAPLRSLDGFSQALLEDYAEGLDQQGKYYLERIQANAGRMGQLIDDLLQLSRVSRGELRREPVDLSALARAIAADLRQREAHRHVEFVIAEGLEVQGDGGLLRVVLENLLGNAWKFTGQRSPARIEFGCESLPEGAMAYFVRDNGAGFDMAYAGKLFGPFQRLHAMSEFPGTGIGLATVQRVVHRHGGRVWAEGAVGQGATFYFTLSRSAP